jgi:hypothetical protein
VKFDINDRFLVIFSPSLRGFVIAYHQELCAIVILFHVIAVIIRIAVPSLPNTVGQAIL